jgi:hypothetical protein
MKYRCHLCEHEEEVAGSASDSTEVVAHSKVLGVTVRYVNGLVKHLAEAEVRHVTKAHTMSTAKIVELEGLAAEAARRMT